MRVGSFSRAFSAKPAVRSTCEAYRELIEQGLALGRNSKAIWQNLVSDHGFAGGYQAVKRFVRASCAAREAGKQRASWSLLREKKHKSTTAVARWCAIRRAASITGRGC